MITVYVIEWKDSDSWNARPSVEQKYGVFLTEDAAWAALKKAIVQPGDSSDWVSFYYRLIPMELHN
jgi:hypothetical protein